MVGAGVLGASTRTRAASAEASTSRSSSSTRRARSAPASAATRACSAPRHGTDAWYAESSRRARERSGSSSSASTGTRIWEACRCGVVRAPRGRLRGAKPRRAEASRRPARVAVARGRGDLYPSLGSTTCTPCSSSRTPACSTRAEPLTARRGRAPARDSSRRRRLVRADDPPADVVVWACGAWLPKLFPDPSSSGSLGATSSSSAPTAPGAARPGSATTTGRSTATVRSAGSARRSRPTCRRGGDRSRPRSTGCRRLDSNRWRATTRRSASRRSPLHRSSGRASASTS